MIRLVEMCSNILSCVILCHNNGDHTDYIVTVLVQLQRDLEETCLLVYAAISQPKPKSRFF